MRKRVLSIACVIISIILMTLPGGVAMTFVPSPMERVTTYFPYFSLMPFGYGNWMPIIV